MRIPHPAGPWPHRLLHGLSYLLGLTIIVTMGVALFLRFVVIPEIDRYRPDIEQLASRSLGMPVHIAAVGGHWQGLHPHFSLTGLTLTGPDGKAQLNLPEVRATLSWSSLPLMDLRLARLELRGLEITAQRDATGIIYVAGIPVNVPGKTSNFPDWLLRQHEVLLIDGQIIWQDDQTKAPPLKVSRLNARMKNLLGHHQMGIKGQLPPGLGEQLDLRANLRGRHISDREEWRGEIYMAVDNTQLDTLTLHAPWSQSFVQAGTSDVRAWIDLKKGQLAAVTGDVHLTDTRLRFDEALPDTLFTSLRGRITWRSEGLHEELSARGLTFTTPSQSASEPADLRIKVKRSPDRLRIESGELETRNLRIETFTTLTGNIPMPRSIHDHIQTLAPRGQITHASGQWNGADKYRINTRFSDIGIKATAKQPGFQGASGHLEANESGGSMVLDTHTFTLDAPGTFRHPLQFKRLESAIQWRNQASQHEIHIKRLEIVNDDLEGQLQGQLTWKPGHTPVADLRARIKQGRGEAVWRYLPETVNDDTRFWLRDSIKAGVSHNAQMRLKGPLNRFPFTHGGGEFQVRVPLEEAKLLYAEHWPVIDNIQGELVFDRAAMHLKASGRSAGTQLSEVAVDIADLFLPITLLEVQGRAQGETRAFIDFVNHSPVKAHSGGFTEHLAARGQANLALKLRLPLEKMDDSLIEGALTLKDNQVSPGLGLPSLEQLNGTLNFTRDQLSGRDLAARLYGEPARLSITPRGSALAVQVKSQLTPKLLAAWLPPEALSRLQGQTSYQLELLADTRQQRLRFTSGLEGLAIQLPAPLGKVAASRTPLRIESIPKDMGFNALDAQYGDIATLRALYKNDLASARIGLHLGPEEAKLPAEKGVEISGSMGRLDLDQWSALADSSPGKTTGKDARLPLRKVNIRSNELLIMGRTLHKSKVELSPNTEGWTIQLESNEADGAITIKERPSRHILADLKRLHWPAGQHGTPPSTTSSHTDYHGSLHIQDLQIGEAKLGQLNLNFKPIMGGMEFTQIKIAQPNDEAILTGHLKLYDDPQRSSNFEHGELQIKNLGHLMDRLGYPNRVKGGKGTFSSRSLTWPGGLSMLATSTLSGPIEIQIKNGQFLEVDPGIARLFGIVNLQSLSRLPILDVGALFSKGFNFDQLNARVFTTLGQIQLTHFEMNGPPARVSMTGQINLNNETQTLKLEVEPHLTDTLVAASGLAAGPIGLVGAWITSKLLKDEISRATPRFHYLVSGTWDKPVVTPQTKPKPSTPKPSEDVFP